MYDFDKLFSDFIRSKGHVHEDEFDEVYNEWLNSKDDMLGATPADIISGMSDEQLIKELKEECEEESPSIAIMESLEKRAPVRLLTSLLYEDNETLVYCAAELLRYIGSEPLEVFAEMLGSVTDNDLFELIIESLKENPDQVREILLDKAESSDVRIKTVIAEILACGGRDERVYKLLCELFALGDNLALYASYFVRYGDERAVAMLYRALNTAAYADYIEIRNAIEALGGIVYEDKDFSSDPDYINIKGGDSGE